MDMLNRFAFSTDYTEVQRFEFSLLAQPKPEFSPNTNENYVQFSIMSARLMEKELSTPWE